MIVSAYLAISPGEKLTDPWKVTITSPAGAVGARAKVIKVNINIPDSELAFPEVTIDWPGELTPDILAEVQDWTVT